MVDAAETAKAKRGQTRAERIVALEEKAKAIQERAKALRAQEKASRAKVDRKLDTRRKILLGAAVLELIRLERLDAGEIRDLVNGLETFTDRDRETMRDAIRGVIRAQLDAAREASGGYLIPDGYLSPNPDPTAGPGSLPSAEA